jgi:hypothetical protein
LEKLLFAGEELIFAVEIKQPERFSRSGFCFSLTPSLSHPMGEGVRKDG